MKIQLQALSSVTILVLESRRTMFVSTNLDASEENNSVSLLQLRDVLFQLTLHRPQKLI